MRKNLSITLSILGIGLFIFGTHISNEASQGEERVSQAEEQEQDHRKPLVGPVRKSVSAEASENAQEKIGEAEQRIVASQVTANWLRGVGIALFVVGMGSLIFNFSRRKRD